jgi:hypothetical protein
MKSFTHSITLIQNSTFIISSAMAAPVFHLLPVALHRVRLQVLVPQQQELPQVSALQVLLQAERLRRCLYP